MIEWPLLSLLIWLPITGGIFILFFSKSEWINPRWFALFTVAATWALCVPLILFFDRDASNMQFTETVSWIPTFNIHYALGVDGFSVPLILLTAFCTLLAVLAGWKSIQKHVAQYMAAFLIMMGLMHGVFAARDAILFYMFWESMLVPMFLIIGIWGGDNRVYATIKFFLYTFLGSILMLVALIYLGIQAGGFSIEDFQKMPLGLTAQLFIFIAFFMAFAVKVPMWPVHTWLPDAHVEAPTGGSVILAAIMLKMGAYGFLRLSLPIAPDASLLLNKWIIALSLIAIVYIGFVSLVQRDMKKLIAYSSIAHMGFVTLGLFVGYLLIAEQRSVESMQLGIEGAFVQVISHGFISAALFLCVGVLYDRMHSRLIGDYGAVVDRMPIFAVFFVLFALANSGLPGTSGFVGEFMVILSTLQANFWIAALAAITLIVGAAYNLWLVKRVIFGQASHGGISSLEDIDFRECVMLLLLAGAVLFVGLYPAALLNLMHTSVDSLLQQMMQSKIG
ncbi:MAG: NADH-quinone oxidoreductase subunit M [Gammaproteobacteria bacterium]|nr:NADH-quinone oxidoreductase subunit M [Gammaproteobacteria bacterium]